MKKREKSIWKSLRNGRGKLVPVAVLLSLIVLGFVWFELRQIRENIITQSKETSKVWLGRLTENGMFQAEQQGTTVTEGIMEAVNALFPTSSRYFCVVGVSDRVMLFRDAVMKTEKQGETINSLFRNMKWEKQEAVSVADGSFFDEERYLIVKQDMEFGSEKITLAVCMAEDYLFSSYSYDICRQQILLQTILLGFAYIACLIYLTRKMIEMDADKMQYKKVMVEQRKNIEHLQERMESRLNGTTINGEGGLYSKEIVEQVLSGLTAEQKKKSRQLVVRVDEQNQDMLIQLGVLLDRLLTGMSVGCLWSRNEYIILLMDVDDAGAMNFARQIIVKYQNTYQKDVTATKISIDRL